MTTHTTVEVELPLQAAPTVGLDQYYSEAGPDYEAWSSGYNMHFGFFDWGMNPFRREAMLERMNVEVEQRLHLKPGAHVLDLGCGVGATMRSIARRVPSASLLGITLVPWQVERGAQLNREAGVDERVQLQVANFERSGLPSESFDAAYGLESTCYARSENKGALLAESFRLLKPGAYLVMADGFLRSGSPMGWLQRRMYRKLCECWVLETLGSVEQVSEEMKRIGFDQVSVERAQLRVAPSTFHIPWVTAKFLLTEVLFGSNRMTRARWNNLLAPVLLPFVSWPLGSMEYCLVAARKPAQS